MAKKIRADQLLFQQNLAESREQAKRFIMAGQVHMFQDTQKVPVTKAGLQVSEDTEFSVLGQEKYASRGAHKLLTAIEHFKLAITDTICLDVGASTGGFTECLLQHGAKKVYAVDVGYGQLHEKLRQDSRVINIERTNMRFIEADIIPDKIDLLVADVSFISLTKILPSCMDFLKEDAYLAVLIKPQFELGPNKTEKGVVHSEELRQEAIQFVTDFCKNTLQLKIIGYIPSSIKGPKGNQEYILYMKKEL